jgi:hypothetical protein
MVHVFGQSSGNFFKIIIFVFSLCNYTFASAQDLSESKYSDNEGNHIYIYSDNLFFQLIQSTGLGDISMVGCGKYRIKRNKILVNTEKYTGLSSITKSRYLISNNESEKTFYFSITDKLGKALNGVNVYYKVKAGESVGKQTDVQGKTELVIDKMPVDSIIDIGYLGYQPLRIPLSHLNGARFSIYLAEGSLNLVEDKKIRLNFKIEGNRMLVNYIGNSKKNALIKQ